MTTDTYSTTTTSATTTTTTTSSSIERIATPMNQTSEVASPQQLSPSSRAAAQLRLQEIDATEEDHQAFVNLAERVNKHLKQAVRSVEAKASAVTHRLELFGDRNHAPVLKRFKPLPELRAARGLGRPIPLGEALTIFHSASVPKIDLWSFGRVLVDDFTAWNATDLDLAAALVLALRYEAVSAVPISLHNMHRLLAAGMLVHIKATRNAIPKLNQKFATALGMSVSEAFRLECGLLQDLDWRATVFPNDVSRMVSLTTLRVVGSRTVTEPQSARVTTPPSDGSDPLNVSVIDPHGSP